MKRLLGLFVALLALFGLAACGEGSDDTIKIGFIGNLSGADKYYGEQVQKGINLAVEEINNDGGITVTVDGVEVQKKISVVVKDDAGTAAQAGTVYNQIKDNVVAIVGPVLSGASEAVASLANSDGVPMITPSGSAESLTVDRPFVFRTCLTDPSQGTYLANFASDKGYESIVVLKNTGSAYAKGICEYFTAQADVKDLNIVQTFEYSTEDYITKLDTLATAILEKNPDCIVLPDYTKVNVAFAEKIHQTNPEIVFLGADGWDGILATDISNKSLLSNCYFTNNLFSGSTDEKIQEFYTNFENKYNSNDISAFAALAYDAIGIVAKAIEDAGSTDKTAVKDAIQAITYAGVTGSITFDTNGNPNREVPVIKIDNGEYVLEKTITVE